MEKLNSNLERQVSCQDLLPDAAKSLPAAPTT